MTDPELREAVARALAECDAGAGGAIWDSLPGSLREEGRVYADAAIAVVAREMKRRAVAVCEGLSSPGESISLTIAAQIHALPLPGAVGNGRREG